jgi:hydroxymethylbilane synthase
MKRGINIGTRSSKLAVIQAESVLTKLKLFAPDIDFSLVNIKTRGDQASDTPLNKIAGEGIFVKELEEALIEGKIDMAVHSLKDMPIDIPHRLILAAVTKRLDPRDAFISNSGKIAKLTPGSTIGTGSNRRIAQVLAYRPDLKIKDLRGNIETRLRKLSDGQYDGIIIAAAALTRLGLEQKVTEYLPTEHFTPEVGQGALGIETRSDNRDFGSLLSHLNHIQSWQCVSAERAFLKALGGGCRTPITALGSRTGSTMKLYGTVAGIKSRKILRCIAEGNAEEFENLGIKLAKKMITMGAMSLIIEAKDYQI